MLANSEGFYQSLGLSYQVVAIVSGTKAIDASHNILTILGLRRFEQRCCTSDILDKAESLTTVGQEIRFRSLVSIPERVQRACFLFKLHRLSDTRA